MWASLKHFINYAGFLPKYRKKMKPVLLGHGLGLGLRKDAVDFLLPCWSGDEGLAWGHVETKHMYSSSMIIKIIYSIYVMSNMSDDILNYLNPAIHGTGPQARDPQSRAARESQCP